MVTELSETERMAEEIQDLLNSRLTEEDWQQLQDTFKAISGQVRWGEVDRKLFSMVFQEIERALYQDLGEFADPQYYRNGTAWYNPSWEDVEPLLEERDPKALVRRHALTLLMIKKLTGILKAHTRRALKGIPVLTKEKEQELLRTLQGEEEPQESETVITARTHAWGRKRGWGKRPRPGPLTCAHDGGTTKILVFKGRQKFIQECCVYCREPLGLEPYKGKLPSWEDGDDRHPCSHRHVQWVPGEEGRKARCADPDCHQEIKNPKGYLWVEAGLEPFGDDPSQDEAITLCSDYS